MFSHKPRQIDGKEGPRRVLFFSSPWVKGCGLAGAILFPILVFWNLDVDVQRQFAGDGNWDRPMRWLLVGNSQNLHYLKQMAHKHHEAVVPLLLVLLCYSVLGAGLGGAVGSLLKGSVYGMRRLFFRKERCKWYPGG
ncbi:MAG: hypothetical protein ACK4RK_02215 [Gemmataceae bacterium]